LVKVLNLARRCCCCELSMIRKLLTRDRIIALAPSPSCCSSRAISAVREHFCHHSRRHTSYCRGGGGGASYARRAAAVGAAEELPQPVRVHWRAGACGSLKAVEAAEVVEAGRAGK
jgi:hypothetical protein